MISGPLHGLKILDLTHVWAGPLAVRYMADLGADVIKVEAPASRGPRQFPSNPIGGWIGGEPGAEPWNRNAVFVKLARNRRSLCIDLKQVDGREAFLQLVGIADVVIENFSARAMSSLALDYPVLKAANPRIIYVTMPGFGSFGPLKDRVAFGPTVEVMSGFTNMMGYSPTEPRNTAMALMDPIAATHAVAAVMTALKKRSELGRGSRVEMSLHEGGVSYCGPWLIDHQLGQSPQCQGNRHPAMAPHGVYHCAGEDQWVTIACRHDEDWHRLCVLIEGLDRRHDLTARRRQHDEIDRCIERWTTRCDKQEVAARLQQAGVPAGPVNTTPDMVVDAQIQARNFFVSYETVGDVATPMPGNPIKMPGLDSGEWRPCPRLGADNREVLRDWLNYSDAEIDSLIDRSVVMDKPPA